ncbi:MAG: AAA family ATPase [Alphaproteobacteria bacterium]
MTLDLSDLAAARAAIHHEVGKAVVGQSETIDYLIVALLSGGHVLLEGPPGTAKTLLARAFSSSLALDFGRIQFTPDLMPGDALGTNIYDFQTGSFVLTKGPIFTDVLLADEINRAPPKTQAALLQVMNERTVTIDGTDYSMGDDFMTIATQNPLEHQGTYPLPEAQLDRFLFKILVDFPSAEDEVQILLTHGQRSQMTSFDALGIEAVVPAARLQALRETLRSVRIQEDIAEYVIELFRATREDPSLSYGASTRAATALVQAARVWAGFDGRDFVLPDDIKTLLIPALRHRVVLSPTAEIEGRTTDDVLDAILAAVPAPR